MVDALVTLIQNGLTMTVLIGHGLLVAGFIVCPVGEISNSVLPLPLSR